MDHSSPGRANRTAEVIYVPMPKSVLVAAPSPAHVAALLSPAPEATPLPVSVLKPPAPIPPRVSRELEHGG